MKKIIGILMIILMAPIGVWAKGGVSVSPTYREIIIDKEKSSDSFMIEIANNENMDLTFLLSVSDFGGLDESGGIAFLGENKFSLASWIELSTKEIVVPAGGREMFEVTIRDRESLSAGGHYGAVLMTPRLTDGVKGEMTLKQSFTSLIFVKKIGGEINSWSFKSLDSNKNWWNIPKEVNFRLLNDGNVHLVARGRLKIVDGFNREIASGTLNSESAFILPSTIRKYKVELTFKNIFLWPGKYRLIANYHYEGSEDWREYYQEWYWIGGWILMIPLILLIILAVFKQKKR